MRLFLKTLILLSLFGAVAYGDNWLNSPYNPSNLSLNNPLSSPYSPFNGGKLPTAPPMTTITPGVGIIQLNNFYVNPIFTTPVFDSNGNMIGTSQTPYIPPVAPENTFSN